MAVPDELIKQAHVFCFANTMNDTSKRLSGFLPSSGITYVVPGEKTLILIGAGCKSSKIAWLVGHGMKGTRRVYNDGGICPGMLLSSVIEKLKSWGYTTIVDTCCEPNSRRQTDMSGLDYWCTTDGQIVGFLSGYENTKAGFSKWWDGFGFYKI